jgi:hypothetical protein
MTTDRANNTFHGLSSGLEEPVMVTPPDGTLVMLDLALGVPL